MSDIALLRVEQQFIAAGWLPPAEAERLREELHALKGSRILSVVFGHHKGAPRPFALRRVVDETGVSGTGIVATGVEFDDGVVAMRWRGQWPTSVVFHDRGMEAVKAVHGHGGKTEIVWLSDELPSLAELEQRAEAAETQLAEALRDLRVVEGTEDAIRVTLEARLAAVQPVIDAARAWRRRLGTNREVWVYGDYLYEMTTALVVAVDALDSPPTEESRTDG